MIAQSGRNLPGRPRLVLGYVDSLHAAEAGRQFRRLGWEVHLAGSAEEVHRLVYSLAPDIVVLDTELRGESGWLTCAKLRIGRPDQKVVLLVNPINRRAAEFADFVGAAGLVDRQDGLPALVSAVHQAVVRQDADLPVVVA